MKVTIEFEIDNNKYKTYEYCLQDFLESLRCNNVVKTSTSDFTNEIYIQEVCEDKTEI